MYKYLAGGSNAADLSGTDEKLHEEVLKAMMVSTCAYV